MIDWNSIVVGPTTAIFGESVLYSPADGVVFSITGVFDEGYLGQASIDGMIPGEIVNSKPVLGVQLSGFPTGNAPAQDDVLTIVRTGESFQVMNVETDGKGAAMLTLNTFAPPAPL